MTRRVLFWVAVVLAVAAPLGCRQVPVEQAAPPVAALPGSGVAVERLEAGRAIYVSESRCARCHSAKPVGEYAASAWERDILPGMAKKAKLTDEEYENVLAYVTVAAHPPVTPGGRGDAGTR